VGREHAPRWCIDHDAQRDDGLVLPPPWRPWSPHRADLSQAEEKDAVIAYGRRLLEQLAGADAVRAAAAQFGNAEIISVVLSGSRAGQRIVLDLRDGLRPPDKFFWWEQRGVPVRLEAGPKDSRRNR